MKIYLLAICRTLKYLLFMLLWTIGSICFAGLIYQSIYARIFLIFAVPIIGFILAVRTNARNIKEERELESNWHRNALEWQKLKDMQRNKENDRQTHRR